MFQRIPKQAENSWEGILRDRLESELKRPTHQTPSSRACPIHYIVSIIFTSTDAKREQQARGGHRRRLVMTGHSKSIDAFNSVLWADAELGPVDVDYDNFSFSIL